MSLTDTPLVTAQYYGDSGGSAVYYYWIQVKYATGDTALFQAVPAPITVMSLSHNNVVALNWTQMPFTVSVSVFRNTTNTPPTLGSSTSLCIAQNLSTANGLVDNGLPTFTMTPVASGVH